jgi:hypothetical protein
VKCPSEQDWLRFELGEVTVNLAKSTEEHARSCPVCRARREQHRQLIEDLGPIASVPGADEAFVSKVMSACEKAGVQAVPSLRARSWAPMTALALAAGIALYFGIAPSKDDVRGTWTARGPHGMTKEGLGVEVLVVRAGKSLPVEGATLHRGDGFAVRYWKTTMEPTYLMAFAIDAAGEVHWIYPAHLDPVSDPHAVPLAAGEDRLLGEVFEPESPAPGPLHVVAIVTSEPLTINAVEQRLGKGPRETAMARLANLIPSTRVSEWNCTWSQ